MKPVRNEGANRRLYGDVCKIRPVDVSRPNETNAKIPFMLTALTKFLREEIN